MRFVVFRSFQKFSEAFRSFQKFSEVFRSFTFVGKMHFSGKVNLMRFVICVEDQRRGAKKMHKPPGEVPTWP